MASNSDEYTPQQYRKYNGQSVFKALSAIGNEASADELANFISQDIGKSEDAILPEVKQVLRRGISNGFLVRSGQFYSFISDDQVMQVDSASKRRRTRRGTSSKKTNEVEDVSEEEVSGDEESDDQFEDAEEMQTDNSLKFRPKVKLYEVYHPPAAESDDEHSEEYDEEEPPPSKRIRLQPNLKRLINRK